MLAVTLAAALMKYVFHKPMFFACIGAVIAVERTVSSSFQAVVIRNIGTIVGGLIGIVITSYTQNIIFISLGLIPIIWIHNVINKTESIVPAAIVYFAVAYMNTMGSPWEYGIIRILGTLIGTLIGLGINLLIYPPRPEANNIQ